MKTQSILISTLSFLILFCGLFSYVHGTNWSQRGQISGWLGGSLHSKQGTGQIGLRYIPEGSFTQDISGDSIFETMISLNMQSSALNGLPSQSIKLYRFQMRLATAQSETRIGLQKISFGPAQLLRSLRWFDTLDPTDPLNLTSGVYALRYRYTFLNNTNIWLWALYGNHKIKGYEFNPSLKESPELGGRLQVPVPGGEIAVTAHTRRARSTNFDYTERRLALDGRWDILVGVWFEAVLQNSPSEQIENPWQKQITLGADNTFALGNGLYFSVEHMFAAASETITENQQAINTSAVLFSYPIGVFDAFRSILYFPWPSHKFYQYYSWQRTFDDFIVNLSLFHYPSVQGINAELPLTGYGAQLMFIYNY